MINIDLSKHITTLGDNTIKVVARGEGFYDSEPTDNVVYSRLSTVEITENDAGGETYNINTVGGGVTVDGGTYNIITAKGE